MIAHFVICHIGSYDLIQLAVASIHKFAGDATVDLVEIPDSKFGDPQAHGRALDQWSREALLEMDIDDRDVVVVMDPDAAILSHTFRPRMEAVFANPNVGIWGAGCREDFGLRVHPMLMAIRGKLFNLQAGLETTFRPLAPEHSTEWRDTGGWYCKCAVTRGWELKREERRLGQDWHWAAAFGNHPAVRPMFVHLGGGTTSDPARMNWLQRVKNRRAIQRRRSFITAVGNVLREP